MAAGDDNKALIRQWVETWNTANVAAVDHQITPTYVRHDPNMPEIHGPEAEKHLFTMYLTAFPDLRFTIDDLIAAEGDKVVARLTARGTQRGELLGLPPTGKHMTVSMTEIFRISEGRIAEQWCTVDMLGMMQQLGALPAPAPPTG
jgi:steroid delta-isomerase-like uncharacterized protein